LVVLRYFPYSYCYKYDAWNNPNRENCSQNKKSKSELLFVELCPKQPYQVQYQSNYHILGFALESQKGYHSFASDRITPFYAPANTFVFIPANCETLSSKLSEHGLAKIIEFIEANLCEDLSLNVIAEIVEMSPSKLRQAFIGTVGQSPHSWLSKRRIERARILLAETEQSIAQISLDCGFSSQSHMTMLFSQHFGTTPNKYRKSFKPALLTQNI
jgi:AraC-like DNA-binding protein